MSSEPERESKLIIDEDWKSQVEAEKQRLDAQRRAGAPPEAPASSSAEAPKPARPEPTPPPRRPGSPPQPTLALLCTSLATQAFFSLGVAYDASAGDQPPSPDYDQARHLIGMLEMLEQKTAGNRSPEESEVLANLLHELRMTFVSLQSGGEP